MFDGSDFTIIPSIRRLNDLETALAGSRSVILLTGADIVSLKPLSDKVHAAGKKSLINMELLGGFGRDQVGIKLLKNYYHIDGVMSTDNKRLGMARNAGLFTIQRFMLTDSRALETTLRILKTSPADAAEILPAMAAERMVTSLRKVTNMPLLAGGFIQTRDDLEHIRAAGFDGVTTSNKYFFSD